MSRTAAAVALVLVATGLFAGVIRRYEDRADRQAARAAWAEYGVAVAARDRATTAAKEARLVVAAAPEEADRLTGELTEVAREAQEQADRLRAEWGDRWRRLGLEAK